MIEEIFGNLDPQKALDPEDPRYEPIYTSGEREDPVARLALQIRLRDLESLQLFSGFRGSGKTTELLRLRKALEEKGYIVVYANALDYLNPAEPIDISDLLILLAGAFGDRLENDLGIAPKGESVWQRISNYLLRTSVHATEAAFSAEGSTPAKAIYGGLNAGLQLKFAIKEPGSFRARLREFLQNRLSELKREVNAFFEEGVQQIRQAFGEEKRIVFIFDQLEQIRGSISNEQAVIRSVEEVFASHLDKLSFPYLHMVYTVPPWIKFVLPGTAVEVLPTFRLWQHGAERARDEAGWRAMRSLVVRRFGKDCFDLVFGAGGTGQHPLADRLIEASGGHFRDLFRLFREVLIRVLTQTRALPVTEAVVAGAINRIREDYLPLAEDDAVRLDEIEATREFVLREATADEAGRASRLLDLHLVLYFSNGGDWYDIHPLLRDEVAKVAARRKARDSQ